MKKNKEDKIESEHKLTGFSRFFQALIFFHTVCLHTFVNKLLYLPVKLREHNKYVVFIDLISEGVSRSLTSHSTLYRSFRGQFLQVR